MKRTEIKTLIIFLTAAFLLFSCDLKIPMDEMMAAKKKIERAYEVKADKYAPEMLKSSEGKLLECHSFLKDEKEDEAKQAAVDSEIFAQKAIDISLPLLAMDTLKEAKQVYEEAKGLYAEKFASAELEDTGKLISESEEILKNKEFWKSHLKSLEAIAKGNSAKTKCLDNIPALSGLVDRLNSEAEALAEAEGSENAESELRVVSEKLNSATGDIERKDLRSAYENITEATENLAIARQKIEKGQALAKVASLRGEIDGLKNSRGLEFAETEIQNSIITLDAAELAITSEKIDEGQSKIRETEQELEKARDLIKKGIAAEKLASVSELYAKVSERDTNKKFKDELDKAATLIAEGNEFFANGDYDEALYKADEAESILNSINIYIEKDYTKKEEKIASTTEERIYVVQLRPKKRDCLWRIAGMMYNNPRLWPIIYMANKDQIKDPDLIFPGQRFIIPDPAKTKSATEKKVIIQDDGKTAPESATSENRESAVTGDGDEGEVTGESMETEDDIESDDALPAEGQGTEDK